MPSNKEGYMKLYYQKNRETLLNNMLQKIECQNCKEKVIKGNYNRHMNSTICAIKTETFELKKYFKLFLFKDLNYIENYKHDDYKNANPNV